MLMYNEKTYQIRLLSFCSSSMSSAVAQGGDISMHMQVSTGPAHGHQTYTILSFFLALPSALVA